MKFTVIGYWGAYPEKESATSCYVLEKQWVDHCKVWEVVLCLVCFNTTA